MKEFFARECGLGAKCDPSFEYEAILWQKGYSFIAGIDEDGRGCLAGPVITGAVIFPPGTRMSHLPGVRDSKQMSALQRERGCALIYENALAVGLGEASVLEIDSLGILEATKLAMGRAIGNLSKPPQHLLVDAVDLEGTIPSMEIAEGDAVCLSISAASVVAKQHRDWLMLSLDRFSWLWLRTPCRIRHPPASRSHRSPRPMPGPPDIFPAVILPICHSSRHRTADIQQQLKAGRRQACSPINFAS